MPDFVSDYVKLHLATAGLEPSIFRGMESFVQLLPMCIAKNCSPDQVAIGFMMTGFVTVQSQMTVRNLAANSTEQEVNHFLIILNIQLCYIYAKLIGGFFF